MAYNKVVYGGNTLIDLTDLDVTAGDVVSGVNFIMADGTKAVGTITVPTKTSELENDSGFISTETDPTVPSWAKASSKPSYEFSEIGSKPTTLSGYGITDAKISSGTITLGSNTITPLTGSSTLFYYDTFTASNYDFTANQYRSLTKSITARTGYSRIIISVNCTSHSALHVFNWSLSSNTLTYEVINRNSSSVSGANFSMKVLYIKTTLLG